MRYLLLFVLTLLAFTLQAQSHALRIEMASFKAQKRAFQEATNEAYRAGEEVDLNVTPSPAGWDPYFLYPSVIRVLNIGNEPTIQAFSETIELLVLGKCTGLDDRGELAFFNRVSSQLKEEGYEVWIEMAGNQKAALLVQEEDGIIQSFVLMMDVENMDGLFVLDYTGKMTVELLMELRNMDTEKLRETFKNDQILKLLDL